MQIQFSKFVFFLDRKPLGVAATEVTDYFNQTNKNIDGGDKEGGVDINQPDIRLLFGTAVKYKIQVQLGSTIK